MALTETKKSVLCHMTINFSFKKLKKTILAHSGNGGKDKKVANRKCMDSRNNENVCADNKLMINIFTNILFAQIDLFLNCLELV